MWAESAGTGMTETTRREKEFYKCYFYGIMATDITELLQTKYECSYQFGVEVRNGAIYN